MSGSNLVQFPADHRDPTWWRNSRVEVRWQVQRDDELPLVTGVGEIVVQREQPIAADTEDERPYGVVGRIVITKVPLGCGDALLDMDMVSSDHSFLASQVLDATHYVLEFLDWIMDELDVDIVGDPIFVLDLDLNERFNDPDCAVAAHAALDALATFGGPQSPLITFHRDGVDPELRDSLRDEGLWTWVHALRAKRYKRVYVAVSPR